MKALNAFFCKKKHVGKWKLTSFLVKCTFDLGYTRVHVRFNSKGLFNTIDLFSGESSAGQPKLTLVNFV